MSRRRVNWPFSFKDVGALRIARAEGNYLYTEDGRRILDAAGGAIAVNVGHGRREVADAVAEATLNCSYVVPPWLTPQRERLLERLVDGWLPPSLSRLHLATGGAEGVETAMKIAVAFQMARGKPEKNRIIGRVPSYHGTTLATLAVGGHEARKRGLAHALPNPPRVPAPYPLRCPPTNDMAGHYLGLLREEIASQGADRIAAVLVEPIVGASGGALVPPDDYWPGLRALCDEFDMLLLADEVMTGFGRTGVRFALEHWPAGDEWAVPDVLVSGKGLAGGYAPLTGVFATEAIGAAIETAGLNVMFHTFAAHPAACAAADKVLEILADEGLVDRCRRMGEVLKQRLDETFRDHPHVAEVRGAGLLLAIEIVKDRASLLRFAPDALVAARVAQAGIRRGVCYYPGGTGDVRDVVLLGPPFTIDEAEIDEMANTLLAAVDEVTTHCRVEEAELTATR